MESGPLGERLLSRKVNLVAFEKLIEAHFRMIVDIQNRFIDKLNQIVKDKSVLTKFEKYSLIDIMCKTAERIGVPFDRDSALAYIGVRDVSMASTPVQLRFQTREEIEAEVNALSLLQESQQHGETPCQEQEKSKNTQQSSGESEDGPTSGASAQSVQQ